MWLDEEMAVLKQDLVLANPFVNGAGTLGFAPDIHKMPFLDRLGAFITDPISWRSRSPAGNRCYLPFPGGFLLHTGWPNPGISRAIARYQRAWADAPLPVIVHLLSENPETISEMVCKIEELDNILAVELGLPLNCSSKTLRDFMDSAAGELPVLVNLASWQIPELLETLVTLQPAAVHLCPLRGSLPGTEGIILSGRLYGPSNFPLTLSAVITAVESGIPIIAGCGVFNKRQAQSLLDNGVFAVGLHAALWGIDLSGLFI